MKNFLLTILIISVLKPVFPVLEYVLNYDFIVAELCENKSVKNSGCDGKCYLRKQMAENSQEEQNTASTQEKKISPSYEILFFDDLILELPQLNFVVTDVLVLNSYQNLYNYINPQSFLKPPIV